MRPLAQLQRDTFVITSWRVCGQSQSNIVLIISIVHYRLRRNQNSNYVNNHANYTLVLRAK